MVCNKCGGNMLRDGDGIYCLQCGWRPVNSAPLPRKRHLRSRTPLLLSQEVLEECIHETDKETESVRRLLQEKKGVRQLLNDLWQEENLAQKFTVKHLLLLECYSNFSQKTIVKLEGLQTLQFLNQYSLTTFINGLPKLRGGRPRRPHNIDLALKLVLNASYQWLLDRETEREMVRHPTRGRRKARQYAHASLKSAYLFSCRILCAIRTLFPDIDDRHFAVSRALWEDKYKPIVLTDKGLITGICY